MCKDSRKSRQIITTITTMGNSAAGPESSAGQDDSRFDGIETLGYRVLGVQPNSPASTAGLVSFLDFLVGANGMMLFNVDGDDDMNGEEGTESAEKKKKNEDDEYYVDIDFPAFLKQNMDTEIELLVYNIKSKTQRVIQLTPTNKWQGTGLLGVTIRADDYAAAEDRLLRILYVEKNSPAAIAGLTPMTDYLLGTTTESFENEDILANVIQSHVDRVVEVYVYNTETDLVRVVSIMPTLSWGGPGLLGCEVGRGYLHRLPSACRTTNGISFERKIRMGARSSSTRTTTTLNITTDRLSEGVVDHNSNASSHVTESSDTSITCAISGNIVHAEPQIELETETDERKFVTLTEITTMTTQNTVSQVVQADNQRKEEPVPSARSALGLDLPPPPNLLGYDFSHHDKTDDIPSRKDHLSMMTTLPPLPPHLPTLSHYE